MVVYSSADELITSRSAPTAGNERNLLVVTDPTGDLTCSAAEATAAARLSVTTPIQVLTGATATATAITAGLRDARLFHVSGHAYSDHGNLDRSALLVAPADSFSGEPRPCSRSWTTASTGGPPHGPQSGRSACQPGHIMPRPVLAAVPLLLRFHRMPVLAWNASV
jgi:hypothetical protein